MSITEQLQQLPAHEFWIFAGLATVATLAAFYFAFRSLSRARIIEDVPTAKIRSAQQGYVELEGKAIALKGLPILAPLTSTSCCWYRYKIEKRGDKNWRTVESDTSDGLFLIEDETGQCIIDPEGAEVTPSDQSVWYGSSRYPKGYPAGSTKTKQLFGFTINSGNLSFGGRYRYSEARIYSGDPLYAIGLFRTRQPLDHHPDPSLQLREKLREWKLDRPSLLKRFDIDSSGEIDQVEWNLARTTAEKEIRHENSTQEQQPALNQLSQPDSGDQPFLLSTLPQFDLIKRYRRRAIFSTLLFLLCGTLATWLLSNYL